jgi:hypothetical protein
MSYGPIFLMNAEIKATDHNKTGWYRLNGTPEAAIGGLLA